MDSFRKTAGVCPFFFAFVFLSSLCAQPARSINVIFPSLTQSEKNSVFSNEGLKHSFQKNDSVLLTPAANSGVDIISIVMERNPSYLVELLLVIPYSERELDMLDAYNAISRIKNIRDHLYFSGAQNRGSVIFKETTRLESATRRTPIPDPPFSTVLPSSETMFLRFDDTNFGYLYIRGDVYTNRHGLIYNMTNFEAVRFLFFNIVKAEKFSAVVYIEPVIEGMLVYGVAGIDLPGFIASLINIPLEIEKRLIVLIGWLTDGLIIQNNRNRYAR